MDKFFFLFSTHLTQFFLTGSNRLRSIVFHGLFSRLRSSHVFLVICHCFGVVSLFLAKGVGSNLAVLFSFSLADLSQDIVIEARSWSCGLIGLSSRSIFRLSIILFLFFLLLYLKISHFLLFFLLLLWWWRFHVAANKLAPKGSD